MVEQLINRIFEARNAAHTAHWKTNSYAAHKALGSYYDGVIDALDDYVEAHQGTFGIVGKIDGDVPNITKVIRDEIVWLNENREKIAKNVPALENLLDALTDLHMKTLYKLENLR